MGARAGRRRGDQRAPREPGLPRRRAARSRDPRDRRPRRARRLRRLAGGHPGAAHARGARTRAPAATSRWSSAPRASRSRAASCCTRSPRDACPSAPVAVLSGPTFAHEVAAGLPTAVTLAAEDRGARPKRCATRIAPADLPHLSHRRRRRRGDRRRGQERARDRLRRGRGQGPRPERARGADRARLCRNDPLRPRLRRAARDAGRPVGPRRPGADLLVDQLAQLSRSARGSARAARPPSCWPTARPSPKARSPRRCSPGSRARRASTCRSSTAVDRGAAVDRCSSAADALEPKARNRRDPFFSQSP